MAIASTAVQGTPQIATNVAQTAPQPETNNYLNRCVQDLDPAVAAMHESNAFLWNVASKATLVGFTVLAVGLFVTVGFLAPVYLPLVGITSFCLMDPTFQLHQKLSFYSVQTQRRADILKGISQEYNAIRDDAHKIERKLPLMDICWTKIPGVQQLKDLNKLKPLIARYEYWKKQEANYEREMNTHAAEASQLLNPSGTQAPPMEDGPLLQKRVAALRLEALQAQENALICKVNAAFVHAVVQQPKYAGTFADLAKFNQIAFGKRALAQHFGDTAADHFIQFKNPSIQPITLTEIRDNAVMPTQVLAQRFVQAIIAAEA